MLRFNNYEKRYCDFCKEKTLHKITILTENTQEVIQKIKCLKCGSFRRIKNQKLSF